MLGSVLAHIWRHRFLITACLVLSAGYFLFFVDRAVVDLSISVDKRTFFRIYWAAADQGFAEERHARVLVSPDRRDYRFYLTDLGRIERLRIDPHDFKGESVHPDEAVHIGASSYYVDHWLPPVVLHRLTFSQKGWQSIDVTSSGEGFSSFQPHAQIAASSLRADGLHTVSSGNDPNYLYQPVPEPAPFGWPGESCRLPCCSRLRSIIPGPPISRPRGGTFFQWP